MGKNDDSENPSPALSVLSNNKSENEPVTAAVVNNATPKVGVETSPKLDMNNKTKNGEVVGNGVTEKNSETTPRNESENDSAVAETLRPPEDTVMPIRESKNGSITSGILKHHPNESIAENGEVHNHYVKDENVDLDDEILQTAMEERLDGGIGWWIVFCSFMNCFIVDGIVYSAGEFLLPKWQDDFKSNLAVSSFPLSLLTGCYLFFGPVISALINSYGCRKVAVIGVFLSFIGFITSILVNSLLAISVAYGLIGGFGFCMIYMPSIVIITSYFDKKKALAVGIACCGTGIGTFAINRLSPYIMDFFGNDWRLYIAAMSVLILSSAFFSLQFKIPGVSNDKILKVTRLLDMFPFNSRSETVNGESIEVTNHSHLNMSQNLIASRKYLSTVTIHCEERGEDHKEAAISIIRTVNNPMTRADAMYPGSLPNMMKFQSTLSCAAVAGQDAIAETGKAEKGIIPYIKKILKNDLLNSKAFNLFVMGGFFTMTCCFVPFLFLREYATESGISEERSQYFVSILGVVNLFGRVLCGMITNFQIADAFLVSNIAIIAGGLMTILVPFASSYLFFYAYCVVFGYAVACFASMRTVIICDIFGEDKVTDGFGVVLMFMGMAAFIGPLVVSLVQSITNSFKIAFIVMGVMMTLSGIMVLPLKKMILSEEKTFPYSPLVLRMKNDRSRSLIKSHHSVTEAQQLVPEHHMLNVIAEEEGGEEG